MHSQSKYLMTGHWGRIFKHVCKKYEENLSDLFSYFYRPLAVYRTIRFFYRSENLFCFVLKIGCISTDVQGVYTKYFSIEIY